MLHLCRCPRPGCGSCVALDMPPEDSRAAASCRRRAVDVQCSCGERFCLSCGMPPHEPAPCAAVSCSGPARSMHYQRMDRRDLWVQWCNRNYACQGAGIYPDLIINPSRFPAHVVRIIATLKHFSSCIIAIAKVSFEHIWVAGALTVWSLQKERD